MEGFIIVLVITLVGQFFLVTAFSIEGLYKTKKMFILHCMPIVGLITIISKAAFGVLKELNDFYKNLG